MSRAAPTCLRAAAGPALAAWACLAALPLPARAGEPEQPVQLHVALREKPGFFARATRSLQQAARRLYEQEQPDAVQGNALAAQNEPEGALKAYDEAEKHIPPAGDATAALALDRSSALLKRGAEEAPHALEQANRALSSTDVSTRAKAAYDAALALESAGKTEDAVAAYGRALALDPDDEDAKVNLELLLRTEERKKQQPQAGQQKDKDKKEQQKGEDQQKQQSKGDEKQQQKDQEQQQGGEQKNDQQKDGEQKQAQEQKGEQQKKEEQQKQQQGEKQAQEQPDPQGKEQEAKAGEAQPIDRSEAQRLLDALRASEKNLQVWRFGKRAKDQRRRDAEKDW